jgi:hypothetical protein
MVEFTTKRPLDASQITGGESMETLRLNEPIKMIVGGLYNEFNTSYS